MKLAIVGTGYVGLVTGTCFAESGNEVTCIDEERITALRRGEIPIYEPGLSELVLRNAAAGRLRFSSDYETAVPPAECVFIAVGTPPSDDGAANLAGLWAVAESLAPHLSPAAIVVIKSTVPVGTNRHLSTRLKELTGRDVDAASTCRSSRNAGQTAGDFLSLVQSPCHNESLLTEHGSTALRTFANPPLRKHKTPHHATHILAAARPSHGTARASTRAQQKKPRRCRVHGTARRPAAADRCFGRTNSAMV